MPTSNDREWRLGFSDLERIFRRDGIASPTTHSYFIPTHVQEAFLKQDIHIGKIAVAKKKKWNHEQ